MVDRLRNTRGIGLMEILIAAALVGLVFTAAISVYLSGIRSLRTRQSVDVTTLPNIALEPVTRSTAIANSVFLSGPLNSQLNVRVDQDCAGVANATASNTADDSWRHYRLFFSGLHYFCDNNSGTIINSAVNPVGTVELIPNLDTSPGGSAFQILNPSASGAGTVVSFHIVSTSPTLTVDTETALSAIPKR